MTETTTTTLGAVLTHTTGILLADIDEAWPLQDFLVGRSLMTHERVPAFGGSEVNVRAGLLQQFPMLAEAIPPPIGGDNPDEKRAACEAWVCSVSEHTGLPLTDLTVTR